MPCFATLRCGAGELSKIRSDREQRMRMTGPPSLSVFRCVQRGATMALCRLSDCGQFANAGFRVIAHAAETLLLPQVCEDLHQGNGDDGLV